ncbi:hypothetical protein PV682_04415 [Streptomyces niveiscabiei]|uniref:hypothetical protein n=1 Tax=Streptomyces niveiscabiei TaxID=164115 RepID=UPI0029BA09B2|nr:hypothetical protein [Streptomyces niveiscabiei]MDX3380691.1 hypothetical protein [Streptomyces niveiscabiei]
MAERSAAALHWLGPALTFRVLACLFPATGNCSRVRPYWTARERARQWKRRRVLVMAAHFRLDLNTRNIHAVPAGSEVR